jgi:hypothetical protein
MFHGHGYNIEVFFYLTIEYEGAALIQNGAKAAIRFGKKGSFNQAGFIFESQKFHGVAVSGMHNFACDQQTGYAYMPSYEARQISCLANSKFF